MIGFASAVQYPMDLGKFSYKTQRLILCLIDIALTLCILIAFLINPKSDIIICIVFFCQVIIGFIYISTLNILCRRQHFTNIKKEILRLNLDINKDEVVIRRELMENSEISCSVNDVKKALDYIKKNNK